MALPAPSPGTACLVTGASSGIGEQLARGLARRGYSLVLSARREEYLSALAEELQRTTGVDALAVPCDLAKPDARHRLVQAIEKSDQAVSILVNCAGLGSGGAFLQLDQAAELDMVGVNVDAVVDLCGVFAPAMVRQGGGAILNVASIAGFAPLPRQATYAATKAFVISFSHALHAELKHSGVTVTTLCPGPTRTNFSAASGRQVLGAMEKLPTFMTSAPDEVAEAGLRALERGRRHVTVGLVNKVNGLSAYFTPRTLELAMMDRFYPVEA